MCPGNGRLLRLCTWAFAAAAWSQNAPPMVVVTGAPYSGEQVQERMETSSDGSRITRSLGSVKMYRDSEGRTRTERPQAIEIEDPVAGLRFTLDARTKTARRVAVTREQMISGDQSGTLLALSAGNTITFSTPVAGSSVSVTLTVIPASDAGKPQPQLATEDLGTLKMEGVLVEGSRQTLTIPAGAQGNDRPITTVTDTWTSPELKIVMLSKVTDPRTGETTVQMTHLSRSEPTLTLFQPPPDYKIMEASAQNFQPAELPAK